MFFVANHSLIGYPPMRIAAIVLLFASSSFAIAQPTQQYTIETVADYFKKRQEAKEPPFMPTLNLNFGSVIGHIGRLDESWKTYRVSQQTNDGTLVMVDYSRVQYAPRTRDIPKWQLGLSEATFGPFLFKDSGVANLPSEARFSPSGNYKISGLHTYQTVAGGSNSVLIVEPLADNEFEAPKSFPNLLLYKHEIKTWNDGKGNEVAKGIYLGYRTPDVWILDVDANLVKASLISLREDDRNFVRKRIKDKKTREHLIPQFEKDESARLKRLQDSANRP